MLILTNLIVYYYISNISTLLQKSHFATEVVLNFFANTRRPRNSFQVAVFVEFFEKTFSFVISHKLAKFD